MHILFFFFSLRFLSLVVEKSILNRFRDVKTRPAKASVSRTFAVLLASTNNIP